MRVWRLLVGLFQSRKSLKTSQAIITIMFIKYHSISHSGVLYLYRFRSSSQPPHPVILFYFSLQLAGMFFPASVRSVCLLRRETSMERNSIPFFLLEEQAGMRSLAKEQEEVSRPNTRQEAGRGISHEEAKNNKERTSSWLLHGMSLVRQTINRGLTVT